MQVVTEGIISRVYFLEHILYMPSAMESFFAHILSLNPHNNTGM